MSPARARPLARPVADAPVGELLGRVEDLAKRWVMALLAELPLAQWSDLPLAELAPEVPSICTGAVQALASEPELDRLLGERGAALGLRVIAAARGPAAAVHAAELLRSVLWRALGEELREPDSRLLADLADRLAYVCARIAEQLVASAAPIATAGARERARPPAARGFEAAATGSDEPGVSQAHERGASEANERGASETVDAVRLPERVVLIDELADGTGRSVFAELDLDARAGAAPDEPIAARDARAGEGPGAWVGLIGRRLAGTDPSSFGVLLIEVFEGEPSAAEQHEVQPSPLLARLEDSLAAELGAEASLTRERPGRYWVLSDVADPSALAALVERLQRTVRLAVASPGRCFTATVGTASAPRDGATAAALAAHADLEALASRDGGRR